MDKEAEKAAMQATGYSQDAKFKKQIKDDLLLNMLWEAYYGDEKLDTGSCSARE